MTDMVADRRTEAFPCNTAVLFPNVTCQRHYHLLLLLLFGPVMLLCGLRCRTFLFYLMSEGSV